MCTCGHEQKRHEECLDCDALIDVHREHGPHAQCADCDCTKYREAEIGVSKTEEQSKKFVCVQLQKVYPYGKEEGCYFLVPQFGEFIPNGEGEGYTGDDLHELFQFEEGKVYRIVIEEVGDERKRLAAAKEYQQKLGRL